MSLRSVVRKLNRTAEVDRILGGGHVMVSRSLTDPSPWMVFPDPHGYVDDVATIAIGNGIAQAVVGFDFVVAANEPSIAFIIRSDGSFDCSEFCRRHGGPRRASAFRMAGSGDPYEILRERMRDA